MTSATVIIASLAAVALAGWWWTAWTAERARDQHLDRLAERDADAALLLDQLDAVTAERDATQACFVTLNEDFNRVTQERDFLLRALDQHQAEIVALAAKSKAALR